jgi:hypothetical protein
MINPFHILPTPRENGFRQDGYWTWDASAARGDDGRWHLFCARWPKWLPMHPGWMVHAEIIHCVADRVVGPYEFVDVVLPRRSAEFWDGRSTYNSHVLRHGDRWVIFHGGSSHPLADLRPGDQLTTDSLHCTVARSRKRVGVATAFSPEGPWTRCDLPILDTRPGTFYSFLTSNPTAVVHADGSVLLVFKSRRYINNTHSGMMLGVARAPRAEGPYTVVSGAPIFGADQQHEYEDPFIWQRADGSYAMIAKDMTGTTTGEERAGIYATSRDGVAWSAAQGMKSYSRTIAFTDGSTQTLGNVERPFLVFDDGKPVCLLGSCTDGATGIGDAKNSWIVALPVTDNASR